MALLRRFAPALLLLLAACGQPLSPADLDQQENHVFPARNNVQVYAASVIALRSLGFQIVSAEPFKGSIKTAPKVINTTATGGQYSATAVDNTIAWTLLVRNQSGGASMYAEPRIYSGGNAVPIEHVNGSALKAQFHTLYTEIDHNL